MKVVLAGQFSDEDRAAWQTALQLALPEAQWLDVDDPFAAQTELAVVANPSPGTLPRLPRLRFVQSLWAGVDRLLAAGPWPEGVALARMVDPAMNAAMAETALWAVLSLHRRFFDYAAQQRAHQWQALPQRRADEVSVLVLGLGEMGMAVAQRLLAQGYRVQGWRSRGRGTLQGLAYDSGLEALDGLGSESDVVVNLLPLTPDTRGLFDARRFAAWRRGVAFVNLARGAQVVDADLLAALDSGQIGRAVLDVFHTEPLPAEHRYWSHPQVTVLPHAAAATDARSAANVAADNLRAFVEGRPVAHLVDTGRGY
jgi:glyoxylate/hydroxypyruvate reductase